MRASDSRVSDRGAPLASVPAGVASLSEYATLLSEANGLELHSGLFRVFGVGPACLGRDGLAWNESAWRAAYRLPHAVSLWGESIFGDQFGLDRGSGALLQLSCEGGALETLPFRTLAQFIDRLLDEPEKWIERDLVEAAATKGLRPSLTEHLSFSLPLICGGSPDEENLEVMDAEAHLDVLGQILAQSRDVPEGTTIRGFNG